MRGGVRWSRDGDRGGPIGAVGGSVMIRRGFWVDGYYTQGRHDEDRGFGVALRAVRRPGTERRQLRGRAGRV